MNHSEAPWRWPFLLAGAVCLVAIGVAVGYGLRPPQATPADTGASAAQAAVGDPESGTAGDHAHETAAAPDAGAVRVILTPDMVARAGIRTVSASPAEIAAEFRVPGVVQPNAYKEVTVTSFVSGRVTQVHAELGRPVKAQEPLATIYSPELADAQTAFITARAEQEAHQQRQTRTQRLMAIGAASREELEMHQAERVKIDAAVEVARARLSLLGIPEAEAQRLTGSQDVVTTAAVRAPIAGVVTRRTANVGLNIDPSTPLFTVVDLSTVWVIADLYERDFSRVRVGSPATVTSASYPDLTIRGRVAYIDPEVQQETRTAKLRVEVPNAGGRLRLGMFVDVQVGESEPRHGVLVPKAAVQVVGGDTVVYLASGGDGTFVERRVQLGQASGDLILVLAGLEPGDQVVTDGVFFVRAERERQHAGRP